MRACWAGGSWLRCALSAGAQPPRAPCATPRVPQVISAASHAMFLLHCTGLSETHGIGCRSQLDTSDIGKCDELFSG